MDKKVFQRFYGSMADRISEDSMREIIDDTQNNIIKFLDKQNKKNTLHLIYTGLDMWYYTKYTEIHFPRDLFICDGVYQLSQSIEKILYDFSPCLYALYKDFADPEKFIKILDCGLEELHKEFADAWKRYKNERDN